MPTPQSVKLLKRFAPKVALPSAPDKRAGLTVPAQLERRSLQRPRLRRRLRSVRCATSLSFAGILALPTVVSGLASALALPGVLTLASMLVLPLLIRFLVAVLVLSPEIRLWPRKKMEAHAAGAIPASRPAKATPAINAFIAFVIATLHCQLRCRGISVPRQK